MPAPGRRNVGASLSQKIEKVRHQDHIEDRRERQAAHRARHAEGWEKADQALTLAQRAEQVRSDHERGVRLHHYSRAVQSGKAKAPKITPTVDAKPRYFLGACLGCDQELWTHKSKPRVPICSACHHKREAKKRQQREEREYA